VSTGSLNKGKSTGRPLLSDDIVDDFTERLEQNPQISSPQLLLQTVSSNTSHKVVTKRLHVHPYKITTVHELFVGDFPRRNEYRN
jgi:hypothetical protein